MGNNNMAIGRSTTADQ